MVHALLRLTDLVASTLDLQAAAMLVNGDPYQKLLYLVLMSMLTFLAILFMLFGFSVLCLVGNHSHIQFRAQNY